MTVRQTPLARGLNWARAATALPNVQAPLARGLSTQPGRSNAVGCAVARVRGGA